MIISMHRRLHCTKEDLVFIVELMVLRHFTYSTAQWKLIRHKDATITPEIKAWEIVTEEDRSVQSSVGVGDIKKI